MPTQNPFDKNNGVPLHTQLKDFLRGQVLQGDMKPHTPLPSEREICERYDISRTTVRRAMNDLINEGLVYTTVGKGTYVANPPLKEEIRPLSSFTEDMTRRGRTASSQVLRAQVENADDAQAARLGIPRGAEVVLLRRLRLADGVPISIQLHWLPHHLCPGLLQYDLATSSLYDLLRNTYHLLFRRAETNIQAFVANGEERRLFQLAAPAAVLVTEQTTYLENGTVIEFVHSAFRGDQYTLSTGFGY